MRREGGEVIREQNRNIRFSEREDKILIFLAGRLDISVSDLVRRAVVLGLGSMVTLPPMLTRIELHDLNSSNLRAILGDYAEDIGDE